MLETSLDDLPTGHNSFFRQLDFIVATLANQDFRALYSLSNSITVADYSARKDLIFKKYRTISEILGASLLHAAQSRGMNVLVETSGRQIASFDYIDALFDGTRYRKLALHFTIDDIQFAERSVDSRMAGEMARGARLVAAGDISHRAVVAVNSGGPYGSAVLRDVLRDAERVWTEFTATRHDWMKASIAIRGNDDPSRWTASAVLPEGGVSPNSYLFVSDAGL